MSTSPYTAGGDAQVPGASSSLIPTTSAAHTTSATSSTTTATSQASPARLQTRHNNDTLGPYLLLQTVGEGEFAKVKLGMHIETGEETAIKLIRKANVDSPARLAKIQREIGVLQAVRHPHIVRLIQVIETEKYIAIVLEYASGGELFDHILAHRYLKERDACRLFAQLTSGVAYLHARGIVHRDLKLENLLLDRGRNLIVTDFGFANQFDGAVSQGDLMTTSCGSPCYAAPELVVSDGKYVGTAVDIWSCGVILYAMLAGYLPYDDDPANPDGDNINQLYRYILATPLVFPSTIGPDARDLLRRMLVPDPARRCTIRDIQRHRWLSAYAAVFAEQERRLAREDQRVPASSGTSSVNTTASASGAPSTSSAHISTPSSTPSPIHLAGSVSVSGSGSVSPLPPLPTQPYLNPASSSNPPAGLISASSIHLSPSGISTHTQASISSSFLSPAHASGTIGTATSSPGGSGSIGSPSATTIPGAVDSRSPKRHTIQVEYDGGDGMDHHQHGSPSHPQAYRGGGSATSIGSHPHSSASPQPPLPPSPVAWYGEDGNGSSYPAPSSPAHPSQNGSYAGSSGKGSLPSKPPSGRTRPVTLAMEGVSTATVMAEGKEKEKGRGKRRTFFFGGLSLGGGNSSASAIPPAPPSPVPSDHGLADGHDDHADADGHAPPSPSFPPKTTSAQTPADGAGKRRKAMSAAFESVTATLTGSRAGQRSTMMGPVVEEVPPPIPEVRVAHVDPASITTPATAIPSGPHDHPSVFVHTEGVASLRGSNTTAKRVMEWFRRKSISPRHPPYPEGAGDEGPRLLGAAAFSRAAEIKRVAGSAVGAGGTALRPHVGAFDQGAVTSREPVEVMAEAIRILEAMGCSWKRQGPYMVKASRPRRGDPNFRPGEIKPSSSAHGEGTGSAFKRASILVSAINPVGATHHTTPHPNGEGTGAGKRSSVFQTLLSRKAGGSATALTPATPHPRYSLWHRGSSHTSTGSMVPSDQTAPPSTPPTPPPKDLTPEPAPEPAPASTHAPILGEPIYGEAGIDKGDEIRFSVEICRIKNLTNLYTVDIRRLRGNIWGYKFVYHALLERLDLKDKGFMDVRGEGV